MDIITPDITVSAIACRACVRVLRGGGGEGREVWAAGRDEGEGHPFTLAHRILHYYTLGRKRFDLYIFIIIITFYIIIIIIA